MALRLAQTSQGTWNQNATLSSTKTLQKKKLLPSPLQLKSHDGRGQWRGRDQVPVSLDDIFFQTPNRGSSPHLANSYICHFVNPY